MRPFLILLFLIVSPHLLFAQKLKTLIADGKTALENKEYYAAENYFKKAISIDSTNTDLQYLYAEACRLDLNHVVAERWYTKIYKKDNGKVYPDALFYLADCKKRNGKYKDAIKLFDKYAKRYVKKNKAMAQRAKSESENCSFALMLIKNPLPLSVSHIDTNVNSKAGEYAPFEKDSLLFFTTLHTKGSSESAFLFSKVKGNTFKKAQPFDTTFLKNGASISNVVFNSDGNKMYCTQCQYDNAGGYQCSIYKYPVHRNKIGNGAKLPTPINADGYTSTQPYMVEFNGKNTLFFASNRPGGEGGMDIWYSILNSDGTWQNPINAGKKVNSNEDEITPFYCKPCQVLYFSSTYHKGMGGFDIFTAPYENGNFGTVENAGYPINSPQNDMYFKYNDTRSKAYFTSNREGSMYEKYETCCNDIYYIALPEHADSLLAPVVKDTVFIAKSRLQTLVPLSLYFNNDEPDTKTLNTSTKKTYTEAVNSYLALKNNYLKAYSKGLDDDKKDVAMNEMEDFFEDSVRTGYQELEQFSELMLFVLQQGEKVSLTIKGYCSPLASTAYNVNLAKRRISSLINYFNTYKGGALKPYLEDATKVTIVIEDVGELKASPLVSDNPNDATNAVYSRAAALERKIQIIAISTKE